MEIRPLLPDLIFRQLEEKDFDGLARSMERALEQGEGVKHVLWGMRRFTGLLQAAPDCAHPTVVLDAVGDLVPTFGDDSPLELLAAAARYLIGLPASPPRVGLFDAAPGNPPVEVVPVSSLEDALLEGSIETTCTTLGRLLRVIQTREYLLEVVLEMVAPERTPDGHLLIHADAVVKALHGADWDAGRGILYRLVEALSMDPVEPAPAITEKPPQTPCRGGFIVSIEQAVPERYWLYLAHAFQAERYAQMRPKAVRWGVRSWIAERLFDGDEAAMDCAEQSVDVHARRRHDEKLPVPPIEIGWRILDAGAGGGGDGAREARRWAQILPDVDPLFRWIAAGAARSLAAGDPGPIVAVNAARWGCHLLGPSGAGVLTERLMERLIVLSREID